VSGVPNGTPFQMERKPAQWIYAVRMAADLPLIERKQQQARQRIVDAADELFAARGFDAVSVAEIAERAEVGRTTFFRHFGDKQEVVFAKEQELLDLVSDEHAQTPSLGAGTATEALEFLQPLVLRVCALVSSEPEGYRRHMQLVEQSVELRARGAAKMQVLAHRLSDLLVGHGWPKEVAAFAGQVALACYWTARDANADPSMLVEGARDAFAQALALGSGRETARPGTAPGPAGGQWPGDRL
jgi:AcrR family transcriptional regulator